MMEEIKTKICTRCKKEFPATLDFFYREKRQKSGLNSACKECIKSESFNYRTNNKESVKIKDRQRYYNNIEHNLFMAKKYRAKNKKIINEKRKIYCIKNKEQIERYRNENRLKLRESTRRWAESERGKDIRKKYNIYRSSCLTKEYVAGLMGVSVIDLTDEVYEIKKLSVLIKRELNTSLPEGFKLCSVCFKLLPYDNVNFYRSKQSKSGLSCRCKVCTDKINNKNRLKLKTKKWQEI